MTGAILALDLGTTSVKAARFDEDGRRAGDVVSVRHRAQAREAGRIDANALVAATLRCLEELDLTGVRVVTTSTVWHAVVPVDTHGEAYGHALTWEVALDSAVREEIEQRLDGIWSHAASGAYVHSSFPLVTWPILHQAGAHAVVDLGSWVIGRLAGFSATWPENIAAGSGLWLQAEQRWNAAAFDQLGIAQPEDIWVAPRATSTRGLIDLPNAMWLPPLGDGLCHNLGEQAVNDRVAVTVGTSGSLRAVGLDEDVAGPGDGLWRYRCDARVVATGGAVTSAGNVLEWVPTVLGRTVPWSQLSVERLERLPKADSSIFGRRGPDYPWGATGSVRGVGPTTTADDLALAWGLDVWRVFRLHYEALRRVRGVESEVVAAGGVLNADPLVLQILADSLGTAVTVTNEDQPALRGAALRGATYLSEGHVGVDAVVSAVAMGGFESPARVHTVEPRDELSRALREQWEQSAP